MKFSFYRFFTFILVFTLFSCQNSTSNGALSIFSNPKDDLIGEFSLREGGIVGLKITKEDGKYFASMLNGGKWSALYQLDDVKEEDYVKIFGDDWKSYVSAGIQGDGVGIFKVKKGHQYKNHTFNSGYFILMSVLGGADIYKL